MPMSAQLSFTIDPRNALVYVVGTGEAQTADWIALFDRVLADPAHRPGMDFLIDRSRVSSIPTTESVAAIVAYYASHGAELGRCKLASVTGNDAAFGMNRMASVFAEATTVTVQVFRERDSAYRWLRPGPSD
jgi:hypothetical protein